MLAMKSKSCDRRAKQFVDVLLNGAAERFLSIQTGTGMDECLVSEYSLYGLGRNTVQPREAVSRSAMFRVHPRAMGDFACRSTRYSLRFHFHLAMAVHASNFVLPVAIDGRHRDFHPTPSLLLANFVKSLLFAMSHRGIRHFNPS